MPFDRVFPRSFTSPSVRTYAPATSGVYGLTNAQRWIYIGVTDNIQATLFAHLRESEAALLDQHPTGFVFEVCDEAQRIVRQNCLIVEYSPVCNRTVSGS